MTVEDKLAITELLYRYAELIDSGDFDGVGQLLARATFGGTGPQRVSGGGAIAKQLATPTRHLVLNPIVEFSPEISGERTATARSTFCVVQNTETVPLQPIVVGRYFDTFSCDDAGWYFTERKVEVQLVGDVSAHLMVDPRAFDG